MTAETILQILSERDCIFDIGQIPKDTRNKLNSLAKKGIIKKTKAYWPYVTSGTCIKTMYFKGDIPE